uniref:Uncharacterized protein n=1 Tax=Arion vulgaris TaxID=1028688 RepID=A0A0B7BMG4_9EUPU
MPRFSFHIEKRKGHKKGKGHICDDYQQHDYGGHSGNNIFGVTKDANIHPCMLNDSEYYTKKSRPVMFEGSGYN